MNSDVSRPVYLRTDEELEAANAMDMAARFASGIADDLHLWRWVIIALHNVAQGVMVLSLRHGNGLLALNPNSYAEWMTAYERHEPAPPEKLDTYLNLYKKVKHKHWGQVGGNVRFVPSGKEGPDIKKLNALRNEFIHFAPKGWSLQVDGLPRICLSVSRMISFLAIETPNVFWHNEAARDRLRESRDSFVASMRDLEVRYATQAR